MSTALAWLNDLAQWFGRWVPRLILIPPTHRGVRFGPRGHAIAVGPGLVCYWPMTHALIQVAVTTQSIQLCGQVMPLENQEDHLLPHVGLLTLNLQFTVTDPVKASVNVLNFHAILGNRAQALATTAWDRRGQSDWLDVVRRTLAVEMEAYGIALKSLDAAGCGTGVAVKNISDWAYADAAEDRRTA